MTAQARIQPNRTAAQHFDVLIVGAGISGIDAAYHLQQNFPQRTFALLETQESFGGTWLTHKYPGIRSDSDLFTFGYKWKPWMGAPIATAEEILKYLNEAIEENDLGRHIRYRQRVAAAAWSSEEQRWTLTIEDLDSGQRQTLSCNFLWMCQGYYRHAEGYTPEWPGMDRYQGRIVHPQTWPDDLEYQGKRVLVIGSGATAATLVPAMAGDCEHITLLQRSPTYFAPGLNRNELADTLRALDVPDEWTHEIVRRKILHDQQEITRRSFEEPEGLKQELIAGARAYLGDDFDIETHFTPKYRPWQQRLAFIPDGDLFQGIASGKASVVTDQIETFTERGVLLKSGMEITADIIVTATGFNLCVLGDIDFSVDGRPVDFADTVGYRGFMFTGVPNMAWVFGYFRASWTLRADLISEYVCRILAHMDELGATVVTPTLRPEDKGMKLRPWVDPDNFNPGYLTRSLHLMPKQGDRDPWVFTQDYWREKDEFPVADLNDGALVYSGAEPRRAVAGASKP
jgi:cation diffusion facilitator CzcD-associated flavoprotein CzcO